VGQVHIQVVLTNHREEVMARLGQLAPGQVHRYETEALIDTEAVRSTIPAAIADRLGLFRLGHTDAKYADGRVEEIDMTEAISMEILGRRAVTTAMVLGEQILLVRLSYLGFRHNPFYIRVFVDSSACAMPVKSMSRAIKVPTHYREFCEECKVASAISPR